MSTRNFLDKTGLDHFKTKQNAYNANTYLGIHATADTATKLKTARTVTTNLASTASATFDGTANITPGVSGVLPVANGGTGRNTLDNIVAGKAIRDYDGNVISTTYAKKSELTTVYRFKGNLDNYSDLPVNNLTVGDTYNIANADTTHSVKAGDNVAWNGTAWDVLAGVTDLSSYVTKVDLSNALNDAIELATIEQVDALFSKL